MKDLTQGNIYKTFLLFSLPIIVSGLLSQSYNIIDTAIAGRWLGDAGLAQIGAGSSYITVLSSLFWGFGAGGAVLVGMAFGKKDFIKLKNIITTAFIILTALCIITIPLSIIFREQLFVFLKVDETLKEEGYKYFSIYLAGLLIITSTNFGTQLFNALGDSKFPLKMAFLSAALNIIGNILSITILGWGVSGIALSSVISALTVDIIYFVKLRAFLSDVKEKYTWVKEDAASIIKIALPSSCQQMILYGAAFLVSPFINAISASATAAYTVIQRILEIATSLYQNSSRSVTNFSSQCVGAGKNHLLRRGVKAGFVQAILFLVPVLVVCSIFAPQICAIFFKDTSDSVALGIAVNFVRFYMPFVAINSVNNLFHSFWRGTANMKHLVSGTFVGGASQVIFTYILAPKYSINGIWTAWILCWTVEALFNYILYISGKWKNAVE